MNMTLHVPVKSFLTTRELFMGMRDMLGSHSVMNFKISQELTI